MAPPSPDEDTADPAYTAVDGFETGFSAEDQLVALALTPIAGAPLRACFDPELALQLAEALADAARRALQGGRA